MQLFYDEKRKLLVPIFTVGKKNVNEIIEEFPDLVYLAEIPPVSVYNKPTFNRQLLCSFRDYKKIFDKVKKPYIFTFTSTQLLNYNVVDKLGTVVEVLAETMTEARKIVNDSFISGNYLTSYTLKNALRQKVKWSNKYTLAELEKLRKGVR